jgi:hypothetical protein
MATLRATFVSMTVDGKLRGWVWFERTAEVTVVRRPDHGPAKRAARKGQAARAFRHKARGAH